MEYIYLGNSGLEVSRLGLGAIPFGTTLDDKEVDNIVGLYLDAGGNFIDTSNLYGGGKIDNNEKMAGTSEEAVGKAIKDCRDKFVIATKGYWLMENHWSPNSVGLSRKYLKKNLENSLKRLGTDYIDLYQCHVWDFYTPVEETMSVLNDFVRQGKILYIGVSNWDGWHVVKGNTFTKFNGLSPIISNQIWYTIADRVAEHSIIPACKDQKVGIVAWGALAEGFLSGKYRRGHNNPLPGSRFKILKETEMCEFSKLAIERNWVLLDILDNLAFEYKVKIPTVAIRYLLQNGKCDSVLLGGSSISHYQDTIKAMDFKLEKRHMDELDKASKLDEPYPLSFYNLFCRKESKFYGGLR